MAKQPDYATMTLDQLNAACDEHWTALRAIRAQIVPDLAPADALKLELEAAVHRAHLNVIQPLRTEHFLQEELLRSRFAAKVSGMTQEQFDRLRQTIATGPAISETVVHEPGA